MENNEMMVNAAVETVENVMESTADNYSGFGLGDCVIGGLALYGAIHVVRATVKLGAKGYNWLKKKAELRKEKPEATEDDVIMVGTDVEKDYKIE